MAQYIEIKAANPDSLLFYRMGDFYELFFADAEVASRTLGIVLTKRGKHQGEDIPMCGVPVGRADEYLQRLIAAGHRVAVCEQLEDPAEARKRGSKAVVRRDVVRLVTAGTITEEALLDPARASVLLAVGRVKEGEGWSYGLAEVDISTGRTALGRAEAAGLGTEIARIEPKEIVLPDAIHDDPALGSLWREARAAIVRVPREGIDAGTAEKRIADYYGLTTIAGFGAIARAPLVAFATALGYIERTQKGRRPALSPPVGSADAPTLQIDQATRANLEITRTLAGERQGSLLATIDMTVTPAGARLLAERLAGPLTDGAAIRARHDAIAFFLDDPALSQRVRDALKGAPDMPRALARLALDRGGPRDLAAVREGFARAGALAVLLTGRDLPAELEAARDALAALDPALPADLAATLADELPLMKRDGGFVQAGHDAALDELRALGRDSRQVIMGLQAEYGAEAEAKTLRIKHNNFLGYFIEVPQKDGERMLAHPLNQRFIHRQTMQGAMRFSTVALSELEAKIASAGERAIVLELKHFDRLAAAIGAATEGLKQAADALAVLDVATSLATLAERRRWSRPAIDDSQTFRIVAGRHPVVEAAVLKDGGSFIPNGCDLSPPEAVDGGRILLVTGPNMAGKSTFLRQNALIAILAQAGSFVPADSAHIGVVDRLFSRVGAADDLARGRSTFMVEMVETAAILNQAGPRSLVILDEIGRGTATFDGLSIAWAAVEHLHETTRARALFATHFHELTALAATLKRLANVTMRVADHQGDVVFLHEVVAGAADRSYGIQVARLAGLPPAVIQRARSVLTELEKTDRHVAIRGLVDDLPLFRAAERMAPAPQKEDALRAALAAVNPDDLSPREALEALYRLKGLA
jgi:DNA mismatch repair protein MutS